MHISVEATFQNRHVHCVVGNSLWATQGYSLYRSHDCGKSWEKRASVPTYWFRTVAGCFTVSSRLLRTGIRNVFPLPSGNLILIADGVFYRFEPERNQLWAVHRLRFGRRPLKNAFCIDAENNLYYGEYWLNPERKEVLVHKSTDDGISWDPVFTFPKGAVRHIHAFQYDPFTDWLWITTGDLDSECKIGFSENKGRDFHFIGAGSELYRAVTLLFTKNHVFWGTDGEREQNYICRWKRPNGPAEKLMDINGPVYHSIQLNDGTILIATGVEGAATEWDDYCRIWASSDGLNWQELAKWRKDKWHPVFGYGTVSFAYGQDRRGSFYFTAQALRNLDGCTFRARISYV